MRVIKSVAEMKAAEAQGSRVLVPTMGALHEGHASLMREAKKHGDEVVVTLFVNPTQFGPGEDLEKYPRTWESDLSLCESESVNILFSPQRGDVYPEGFDTSIRVGDIASRYEGACRPGHFDGVATVVTKLFNICEPDFAVFGKKDRQQCAVIAKAVADLNQNVQLVFSETVRESTGLAMSSRNRYFSPEQRIEAAFLYQVLADTAQKLKESQQTLSVLDEAKLNLTRHGFDVDYFDLVNPESYVAMTEISSPATLIVAARFNEVRLIDNLDIYPIGPHG
ncbi:MAG: pantoate--beta-alanine ligase [Fimbriimonadaceae bacterium]|nr:pantoate--beta-alanine ligase [Fimbriimonadaceae bacterium]